MWSAEEVAGLLSAEAALHQRPRRWLPTARELLVCLISIAVAVPLAGVLCPTPTAAPPLPGMIELVDPFSGQPVRCTLAAGQPTPRYVCRAQEAR